MVRKQGSVIGYSASYTFDGNGNRLTKTVNGATENYSYDDGDKLLSAGAKTYQYDAAGRTTQVKVGLGAPSILTYDDEDRLKTTTGPIGAQTYTYNGFDTRVAKAAGGSVTAYHRDGSGVTAPLISDTGATYTRGISERRNGVSTFLNSGLKDVSKQTDSTGNVTATRKYDAYGMVIGATGAWKGPFGYSGSAGYQEDETGLQLLGHRYYDSSTGRFITRDPIKDGQNWYAYCGNNPVNRIDADGLKKLVIVIGDIGGPIVAANVHWWLSLMIDKYGIEYDIVVLHQPTNQELAKELEDADAFMYYGHGFSNGDLNLNGRKDGRFGYEQIKEVWRRRLANKNGKMEFVDLWACYSDAAAQFWLAIALELMAWTGSTGNPFGRKSSGTDESDPPFSFPKPPTKIGGGGVKKG